MSNQASEDLFAGLDKISGYNRLLPTVKGQPEDACNVCGLSPESLKEAIQSLIRTEKLKLLAEVRERVVGEDLPLNTTPDTGQRIYNKVKANERTTLTKLEAEL